METKHYTIILPVAVKLLLDELAEKKSRERGTRVSWSAALREELNSRFVGELGNQKIQNIKGEI